MRRLFLGLSLVMIYPLNHGYKGAMISSLSVPARPKAFGELNNQYYFMLAITEVLNSETVQELADSEINVETYGTVCFNNF